MSPKSSTLLHVYDKITVEKCSYCFLCFRTATESKLKAPQPHLKTTTSLSKLGDINKKPPQICYMCEALAVAAAKFRKAAFFATSINMLFNSMMQSEKYQNEVRRLLDKNGPIDPKDFEEHRTLFIDEQELTVYRKSMQLQKTDILVVDTNNTRDTSTTVTMVTDNRDPMNTTEISDESNSEMEIIEEDSNTDDVIILDDDTLPPVYKTIDTSPPCPLPTTQFPLSSTQSPLSSTQSTLSNTQSPLSNTQSPLSNTQSPLSNIQSPLSTTQSPLSSTQSLIAVKTEPNTPTLRKCLLKKKHSKAKTKNMVKVDDIMREEIVKEIENTKLPTLVPIERLLKDPEPVVIKDKTVGFLHPVFKKPDGSHAVPSLSAQIVDGQLMFVHNQLELPKPMIIENNTIIVPTPSASNVEADNEDITEIVDKLLVEKLDSMRKSKSFDKVVVDGENKVVKEPLMKTDRIDWEDKIPMDIISFVDATDPHPPSYIQPLIPGGGISDVRSLQDNLKNSVQAQIKNRGTEDVIDLC